MATVRRNASVKRRRVCPADALALARRKWDSGERLDVGQLARELGVGRATLFRWFGSRENLYAEVIIEAYAQHRAHICRTAVGTGLDLLDHVVRRNLSSLASAAALRKFIEQDPEFAIRLLTSPSSPVQARTIALEVDFLREVTAGANITPRLDLDTLAYVIVRIGEAFIYADTIAGNRPDIEKAVAAIHILVSAEANP
ncbi:MAG: QsdR family transcriptional regulator [Myxococcales bacterium]|nr:QsdR family transcriptional regulator [Myxococcales bacterium]